MAIVTTWSAPAAAPASSTQADHARFSAAIALAWGNERFRLPPIPSDGFTRGVALHDRGHGELDNDPLLATPRVALDRDPARRLPAARRRADR